MIRAAIYARFSSQMQSEASIEDQLRICRERAAREGWTVTEEFSDMAISGASMQRPGVQRLLDDASRGCFDIVIAEALDRLSRDQADVATLFKRLSFHGVRIVTLSEGEVSELHVGLKGTMNQLFLKDLAAKTHRGLRGRVEAGHSGGGNSYGYDVVRRLGEDGMLVTGERTINADEATLIRRIFQEFSEGLSPKAIAKRLNAERIPGPRGKAWRDTAIRGHRIRGTGLLNNELYIGRLVWNRLRYIKDPESGRRVSRLNPSERWITTEVPELRIVDDALWARVKQRQGEIDASPRVQAIKETRFWEKKRSIHLLTGLLRCGCCGSGFAAVGKDYLACSAARKLGTCDQKRSFKRHDLEEVVLNLLRERLMRPEAVAAFVSAVGRETNAGRADATAARARLEAERTQITRRLDGLYDAIADGLRTAGLKTKLEEMELRLAEIDAKLQAPEPTAVRIHPQLSEIYRRKVEGLSETLADPEIRPMALDTIRGLIQSVTVHETTSGVRIDLDGAITALVGLAQPGAEVIVGSGSVEVVAGGRNRLNLPDLRCMVWSTAQWAER
ncbi:resolvase [Roseovarius mucosus]|uniref:Resolvase n=1 Tax=Roseovarius mucosus TaxID=215743 RepID=A0A1V0RUB8_9RHOB|nr:recombinase family protein [Roseovarius mucosus]ARE85368.1 resolvase [Roseovarius mucosus]